MVEQFCRSILQIVGRNTKALANLVMGLASQTFAKSVVEVSLSKVYHYSSINKTIGNIDKALKRKKGKPKEEGGGEKMNRQEVEKKFAN